MSWTATAGKIGSFSTTVAIASPAANRNDSATPKVSEYNTRFPVGVVIDSGAIGALLSVWRVEIRKIMDAGMYDILSMNAIPKEELPGTTGEAKAVAEVSPDGRVKYVPFASGSLSATADDSLAQGWYPLAAGAQTTVLADDFMDKIADIYDLRPAVLAVMIGDDLVETSAVSKPSEATKLITAWNLRDNFNRPAFGTYRDNDLGYAVTPTADRQVFMYSMYPATMAQNGTDTKPEGDFHDYTNNSEFITGSIGVRFRLASKLPGEKVWMHGQVHQTKEDSNPTGPWSEVTKRYPYPREMQMMFWMFIGEGITGIYWFTWTTATGTGVSWDGLGHVNSVARLSMATSLAQRLTPAIRLRLLKCERDTTDRWTVTGGVSTGYVTNYTEAYKSTLYDAQSNVYYLVIVNHSSSTANITITGTSGFTTGNLINLETGVSTAVGGAVSMAGFDGSIWKWIP